MSNKQTEGGEAESSHDSSIKQILKAIGAIPSIIVLVLGALFLAEGVYGWVTGNALFYPNLQPSFKIALGFIVITLSSDKAIDAL